MYFFNEKNKYDRNATIGFTFTGEWNNIRNSNLTLLASDLNRKFIDVTGIPANINYTLSDDKIFHITEASEGSDDGDETEIITESQTAISNLTETASTTIIEIRSESEIITQAESEISIEPETENAVYTPSYGSNTRLPHYNSHCICV
ncbi:hypothetical protein GPJ56_005958 [Histomonas meleagridis]|uniref:uncharacterized protein n=1 Tax=Histomonas meleagridis TaxID=135588 RepID=UPI00355962C8|nr:hypothetical protein GPJ56_005958 [Histomonas meleagridis]KAH0799364.1 hypothetical protein GO595_007765 [Histomonas meleagridis]